MGYHTSISWYCCSTRTATRLLLNSIVHSFQKIRNPNIEIRNKFENQKSKKRSSNCLWCLLCSVLFGFVSDFDIRISDLLFVICHCLVHAVFESVTRQIAQLAFGFLDAEIEIVAHELQLGEGELRSLFGP